MSGVQWDYHRAAPEEGGYEHVAEPGGLTEGALETGLETPRGFAGCHRRVAWGMFGIWEGCHRRGAWQRLTLWLGVQRLVCEAYHARVSM